MKLLDLNNKHRLKTTIGKKLESSQLNYTIHSSHNCLYAPITHFHFVITCALPTCHTTNIVHVMPQGHNSHLIGGTLLSDIMIKKEPRVK